MRKLRAICAAGAAGLLAVCMVTPAQAAPVGATRQAAAVSPAYEPGASVAIAPKWNPSSKEWDYKCSFAGWRAQVDKYWTCSLQTLSGSTVDKHTGVFLAGGYVTALYGYRAAITSEYCTMAYAYSVDGGDSDTQCA